jgi:DNA-binding beta-propeller fold protein YncE
MSYTRLALILALAAACRGPRSNTSGSAAAPVRTSAPDSFTVSSSTLAVTPPHEGWQLGRVSWAAADRNGLIYLLQRGDKADPIVVVNREGKVVRSWGKGLYSVPHSIRVDREGNVWTTDALSSDVRKFSPDGKLLLTIAVGDVPADCIARNRRMCGTSDVAVARDGHVYITDGYWNARVLEYTADGRKLREWGTKGTAPGQFNLPHSIVIADDGTVYVADRDNSRVQRFDPSGRFLGEWRTDGDPFSLELVSGIMWLGVGRRLESGTFQPTLMKADPITGRRGGIVVVAGGHGLAALPGGNELVIDVGSTAQLLSIGPPR